MIKKLTAVLSLLTVAPSLFAWGLLSNAFEGTSLLPDLLGKRNPQLKVCVREIQPQQKGNLYVEIQNKELTDKLVSAFSEGINGWFNAVRQQITQANRQREFADILSIIPQNVSVQLVKECDSPDVIHLLYKPNSYSYHVGEALTKDDSWETHQVLYRAISILQLVPTGSGSFNVQSDYRKTMTHEIGHLLGLSDQYGGCPFDSLFRSPYCDSSVVMGYADFNLKFSPDDVDGLINAIDFYLAYHTQQITPRVQAGWRGFYGQDPYYYSYIRPYHPKSPDEDSAVKRGFEDYWKEFIRLKKDWEDIGQYYINLQAEEDKLRQQAPGTMVSGKMRSRLTELDILDMMADAKLMYLSNARLGLSKLSNKLAKVLGRPDSSMEEVRAALNDFKSRHPQMPKVAYDMNVLNKTEGYFFIGIDEICAICGEPITDFTDRQEGRMTKKIGNKKTEYSYVAHSDCIKPAYEASQQYQDARREKNKAKELAALEKIKNAPQPQEKYLVRGKKGVGHNGTMSLNYGELVEELKVVRARKDMPSKNEVDARVHDELHKHVAPADSAANKARKNEQRFTPPDEDLDLDLHLEDIPLPDDPFLTAGNKKKATAPVKKQPAADGAKKQTTTPAAPAAKPATTPAAKTATTPAAKPATTPAAKPVGTTPAAKPAGANTPAAKPAAVQPAAVTSADKKAPVTAPATPAAVQSEVKKEDPAQTPAQTKAKTNDSATVGFVGPTEKVSCEICGKEIRVGQSYFKRGSGKGIHRHNKCAYTYFAKQHAVDEKSLASYTNVYWFTTPKNVANANQLMKDLDLTVAQIRQFRSQAQYAKDQETRRAAAEKQAENNRRAAKKAFDADCQSYQNVTEADMQNFEQANRQTLAKIEKKTAAKEALDNKELRVQKRYEEMKKNKELTAKCAALQRKSERPSLTDRDLETYPQAWVAFLKEVSSFQQHAYKHETDADGVFKGAHTLTDLYFKLRNDKSYLFTMQMYAKINRKIASGSEYGSVADYLLNVLNGKEGKSFSAEALQKQMPLSAAQPLAYKRQALATDKKAFARYEKVVLQLEKAREKIRTFALDKKIGAGEASWAELPTNQQSALPAVLKELTALAQELAALRAQPEFKHVAYGLTQDTFYMNNGEKFDIARFFAAYGRWASHQDDGVFFAELGEDLVKAQK